MGDQKNQNNCWYRIGSPFPAGSKKLVFKFWSVNSIVTPAARTGNDRGRTDVISTDHTDNGVWYCVIAGGFMLKIVVMKLIAPRIDDTSTRCSEKIVKSKEALTCVGFWLKGDRLFIQFLLQLLKLMMRAKEMMGEGVRNLHYLFEEKHQSLKGLVSFQSHQLW